MNLIVQKYGGSSVADTTKIKKVAEKIKRRVNDDTKLVVVVSAMGKTTDQLLALAKEISAIPNPRELDMLVTTGEQVSVSLLSMALQETGLRAKSLNSFQAGITATSNFTDANIKNIHSQKLRNFLNDQDVLIITGFQGITENNDITTLGRGGSDTSAVAIAAALNAQCEIYSDFPGIFTTDPRIFPAAKKLKHINYDEIMEMSRLGANVLHTRAVEIAKKFNVPLYCGATFSEEEGTIIDAKEIETSVVTGMSIMEKQTRVTIGNLPMDHKTVNQVFAFLGDKKINIDMISIIELKNTLNLSFTYIEEEADKFETAIVQLQEKFIECDILYRHGDCKISVVGLGMRSEKGVASRFFRTLENIPIELVTTSEIKISALIRKEYKNQAVQALAKEFNL
ncbi:MAG: aspartate kinase [Candidatus Marinimicrobia bacterium]|nr:aspartate kinase [Candidatus Neomarinimicrobiota bacterium]